jgi:uncharacterized protein
VTRVRPGSEKFLDTSYAVALASKTDAWHQAARAFGERINSENIPLVTTHAVLLEIANSLAKSRQRKLAVQLVRGLQRDRRVQVVPVGPELFAEAFSLYEARPDKDWGLTDCISFVVMQRLGIREALTADHHFEQAGFRALLR